MPPTGRYRYKDERSWIAGYLTIVPSAPYAYWCQVGRQRHNWDTIGDFGNPHGLSIVIDSNLVGKIEGRTYDSSGNVSKIWDHVPLTAGQRSMPEPRDKYPSPTLLDLNNFAWQVLARTNPNVPSLSVPVEIGELRDIPELARGWGNTWLARIAKGFLTYRWFVKPATSALEYLTHTFPTSFEKRRGELARLFKGQEIRKRAGLGRDNIDGAFSAPYWLHTSTCLVGAKEKVSYTKEVWGTVRWKLDPSWAIPPGILKGVPDVVKHYGEFIHGALRIDKEGKLRLKKSFKAHRYKQTVQKRALPDSRGSYHWEHNEFDDLVRNLETGLNQHAILSTLWELCPWSWLIDWFIGIGDTIDATNNTIPLTWSAISVMRTLVARRDYEYTSWPAPLTILGLHREERVRKERYNAYPLLPFSASIPWLTTGQFSILGALAALKTDVGPRSPGRKTGWKDLKFL